jgi:hypothetical protein
VRGSGKLSIASAHDKSYDALNKDRTSKGIAWANPIGEEGPEYCAWHVEEINQGIPSECLPQRSRVPYDDLEPDGRVYAE